MRYDMDININSCYVQYAYMHTVAEYSKQTKAYTYLHYNTL